MAGPEGTSPPGSVITVDDEQAEILTKLGYAVKVDEPKIVEPQDVAEKPAKKAVKKNVRK